MEFEWDETKCAVNFAKHSIDFRHAIKIWNDEYIDPYSERVVGKEQRATAVGTMLEGDRIIVVVYVWRNGVRRIISARRARRYEREDYQSIIGRGQ